MRCVWQVEKDFFAIRVLEKHWPHVRRFGDVARFPPKESWCSICSCRFDGTPPECRWCKRHVEDITGLDCYADVIAGGFPCEGTSNAGERDGLSDDGSGLWREFARIIRLLRPRFVIVENVAGLLVRGFGDILRDLAESGYDAEWQVLPAAAFGCDHLRERVFIIAYPVGTRFKGNKFGVMEDQQPIARHVSRRDCGGGRYPARTLGFCVPFCRVAGDGIRRPVAELKAIGKAVVPSVAEWIGRRILEAANP